MSQTAPVLEIDGLEKYFEESRDIFDILRRRDPSKVQAVDGISLSLDENESTAVIGESGCGKTTLLLTLIGLHEFTGGEIYYRGTPLSSFDKQDWKEYRSKVQVIFQDPFNSLDPKMTVEESLKQPLRIHGVGNRDERVRNILEQVELNPPETYLRKNPMNLSGGEKQRVSIGRALILEPDLILADEPVSMLDVSTQAAVLNMMKNLINDFDVSMIYISHDLSTVSYISESVNVMYLGRIIESAPTEQILAEPQHPYSKSLVSAIPVPDPHHNRSRTEMSGAPRDPIDLGEGCRFRDRCPEVISPAELDIDQSAYQEIIQFREALERGAIPVDRLESVDGVGSRADLVTEIKREYFEQDLSGDDAAVVNRALELTADGDQTAAAARLQERFQSICEKTPEMVEMSDEWTVACHKYYDHSARVEEHDVRPN